MKRKELCDYLHHYLRQDFYRDASFNGLQVEGAEEIVKVSVATDARLKTFEMAASNGSQMLLVHHGLLWGRDLPLVGMHAKRIQTLLQNQLNLYASHLPLDAHPEIGNNIEICKALHLEEIEPWAEYKGQTIGFKGKLPTPQPLEDFLVAFSLLIENVGGKVQCFGAGKKEIQTVGVVSGDASQEIYTASSDQIDVFITGEPNHIFAAPAEELGCWMLCGGHYATETFGVRALGKHLQQKFGLEVVFLDAPTFS